jgi:hypothetical protein
MILFDHHNYPFRLEDYMCTLSRDPFQYILDEYCVEFLKHNSESKVITTTTRWSVVPYPLDSSRPHYKI